MESSERLSSYDAALLHFISEVGFGHTGSISLVDGDFPFDEFTRDIEAKVAFLPRFRQVPMPVPFNIAYPTWEYDPEFVCANHMDHVHLEAPGTWEQLLTEAAAFFSARLRTDRPYWFARLVTGLEGNQSAILFKIHHAVMDGVGATEFQRVVFEEDAPENSTSQRTPVPPFPSATVRLARGLCDNLRTGARVALHFPAKTIGLVRWLLSRDARETVRLRNTFLRAQGLRFPFNTPCSGEVRIATTRFMLDAFRAIGQTCDATINDVLLGIIGRAVQRYAQKREIDTMGKVMKIQIPVNMRSEGDTRNMGNIATLAPVPIPLDKENPIDLIQSISTYMRALKRCRAPLAMHRLIGAILFCMSPVFAPMVQRSVASVKSQRNSMQPGKKVGAIMVISNVPRRPVPLRLAGRPVTMRYPVGGTTPHIGIGCVAMTCGQYLGLTFAVNSTGAEDLKELVAGVERAFEELSRATLSTPV